MVQIKKAKLAICDGCVRELYVLVSSDNDDSAANRPLQPTSGAGAGI